MVAAGPFCEKKRTFDTFPRPLRNAISIMKFRMEMLSGFAACAESVTLARECVREDGADLSLLFFLFYQAIGTYRDRIELSSLHLPINRISMLRQRRRDYLRRRSKNFAKRNNGGCRNVDEDVFSNLGHYENDRAGRCVSVYFIELERRWMQIESIRWPIQSSIEWFPNREEILGTTHAGYFIFCEATTRRNFSIPMAA